MYSRTCARFSQVLRHTSGCWTVNSRLVQQPTALSQRIQFPDLDGHAAPVVPVSAPDVPPGPGVPASDPPLSWAEVWQPRLTLFCAHVGRALWSLLRGVWRVLLTVVNRLWQWLRRMTTRSDTAPAIMQPSEGAVPAALNLMALPLESGAPPSLWQWLRTMLHAITARGTTSATAPAVSEERRSTATPALVGSVSALPFSSAHAPVSLSTLASVASAPASFQPPPVLGPVVIQSAPPPPVMFIY
jgi:hypothetical protein